MTGALTRLLRVLITLLSHHRRHPLQTLFLLTGLVTGVALWSAVQVINAHARASYAEADQVLGAQASHWVRSGSGEGVSVDDYVNLRRQGWRSVFPILEQRLTTADQSVINLIATDLLALPDEQAGTATGLPAGGWMQLVTPPHEAWYPEALAQQLGLEDGDRLTLNSGKALPPARVFSREQQGLRVFMDVGAALTLLDRSHLSYLVVAELPGDAAARLRQDLAALNPDLRLVANQQRLDLTELTQSLHTQLAAMSLLSFAVGLFIVFNAVRFSLSARRHTLTTLRELGVSQRLLLGAIALETLVMSVIGTLGGLGLGYGLSQLLLPSVAATLQNLYGAVLDYTLLVQPVTVLQAWLLTSAGLVLALAWPLWRQAQRSLQDQRDEPSQWQQDERARGRLALGSLVLALLALGLYFQLTSIAMGFTVLALILFAGAGLLPWTVALILRGVQRALPDSAWRLNWACGEGLAQLGTLRTALMALLLALTANFGVDSLVDSFRTSLSDWLQQRLAADLFVQSDTLDIDALLASPGDWLVESHRRNGLTVRWQNRPTQIRGLNTDTSDTRALPLAAETDRSPAWFDGDPGVVLANEQVRYLAGIDLGETVQIPVGQQTVAFEVVGFYHDYGNPGYQFYLPYQRVAELWPNAGEQGLGLWLSDQNDALTSAEAALVAAGARPGDWTRREDVLAISLRVFDRTFAMTAAINALTFTVAGIALLASLLAIHQQRLPSYAHWRSMGVRNREWLLIAGLPLGIGLLVTWLLSIPLGTLLAGLLIYDLNVLSFGWTMPLIWRFEPARSLFWLTLLVAGFTFVISAVQARLRLPQALKHLGEDAA
ncbi:FtsX-like permease family protein [Saccharospirillum alexandrii]|uniref:FtsX-like permease family protein n=1 Tax=Saccharospirillum alexandrii TaxID=2448477 RepID=UPI0037353541